MELRWCGECGASMARNGGKEISYQDLGPQGAVRASVRLQRHSCRRCGRTEYAGHPETVPGTRMTPRLVDALAHDCCRLPIGEVAARHGLDPRAVRAAWASWSESFAASLPHPETASLGAAAAGTRRISVAGNAATGVLVGAFAGLHDRALRAWLASHPGGVLVTDHRHALASREAAPRAAVVCGGPALAAWFEGALPHMLAKARKWMDDGERRALRSLMPLLAKPDVDRSPQEDRVLLETEGPWPRLRDLRRGCDGFRRIWTSVSWEAARDRYASWRGNLSPVGTESLSSALTLVERLETTIFRPEYDIAAGSVPVRVPHLRPERGESDDRFARRMLGLAFLDPPRPWEAPD